MQNQCLISQTELLKFFFLCTYDVRRRINYNFKTINYKSFFKYFSILFEMLSTFIFIKFFFFSLVSETNYPTNHHQNNKNITKHKKVILGKDCCVEILA